MRTALRSASSTLTHRAMASSESQGQRQELIRRLGRRHLAVALTGGVPLLHAQCAATTALVQQQLPCQG
jgi:hypothetical protein